MAKAAAESKESPEREFKPKETSLSEPKEGQHDDKEHSGGNKWAGGVRLFLRFISQLCAYNFPSFRLEEETLLEWAAEGALSDTIKEARSNRFVDYFFCPSFIDFSQVSDELKEQVPEHIREKAREMARQELKRRLEELDMSASQARGYSQLLDATSVHMASLLDLLERALYLAFCSSTRNERVADLAAKEEERVWIKRQTDGELDDGRLTEGLTGESTVYKRRGMEKPEIGRPQLKSVPATPGFYFAHVNSGQNASSLSLISQLRCIGSSTMAACNAALRQPSC